MAQIDQDRLASLLYIAYAKASNWLSIETGGKLPPYSELQNTHKEAWRAVAQVALEVQDTPPGDPKPLPPQPKQVAQPKA